MVDRVRRIELFVRAAEAGSFARAAKLLELDPSAVSHAITELERELRVTLFYRTTRQLRLTEDGEDVLRRGREILRELAELESVATEADGRLTGILRVGMHVPISRHVVMPRLPEFMRRHPELRLECLLLAQVKDLHAAGLDVLLRAGEPPEVDLIARKLAEIKLGVYASPAYLDEAGEPATPEELLKHRCLIHKPPSAMRPWDEWTFERDGERRVVTVPRTVMTDDREGLIAAVLAGGGLMRIGMFDPGLITAGRLRRVLREWQCPGGPPIYGLYRRSRRMAPKIAAFLEFAAEVYAAFDPDEATIAHPLPTAERVRKLRA
jgi:DNA-binding transcriptional LysR family regulator